ncbi:MAG: zf-HC2 domain-containing protein [bacterium]|nr:zf-HC2 domain-containing protein [bacterium]
MEKCKKNRKLIWLTIYNELSSEQKSQLEIHLQACSDCQSDYEEALRLRRALDEKIQVAPTAAQLEASRAELHQRLLLLSQPRLQKSWFDKVWQIVSLDFAPSWRFATAVALLTFGVLIGNFYSRKAATEYNFYQQQISELLESNISNIESVTYDPVTRQVAIELNTLNDFTIQGNIEKPEIQQLLAHSIVVRYQNLSIRKKIPESD